MPSVMISIGTELGLALLVGVLLLIAGVVRVIFRSGFNLGKYDTLWEKQVNDIKSLRELWDKNIPGIKEDIIELKTIVNRLEPGGTTKSGSPITLTDVGSKISKELDANDIVEKHADTLRKLVDARTPKTAYDLQQGCFAVVEEHMEEILTEEQLKMAKQQAVSHGILLDNVLAIFGVILRDKLLDEKGLNLYHVDERSSKKPSN